MRHIQIVLLISIAICSPSCGYLPFVDMPINNDFERKQYVFDKEEHHLIETDSVNIVVNAETAIPKRYRSRRLKIFFAYISLDVKKYLFDEYFIIPLNPAMITCSDGKNTVTGDAKLMQTNYVPRLVIRKNEYFLAQASSRTNSPVFKFDYSHLKEFNYNNLVLKINLGDLKLPNGKVVKSKEIICRFQQKS